MNVPEATGKKGKVTLNEKVKYKHESLLIGFFWTSIVSCAKYTFSKPINLLPFCIGIFYSGLPYATQKQSVYFYVILGITLGIF